jgi:hypothetical protein
LPQAGRRAIPSEFDFAAVGEDIWSGAVHALQWCRF